jgi:hypothetical protein
VAVPSVDARDQAPAVLRVLVGEAHAAAHFEVGAAGHRQLFDWLDAHAHTLSATKAAALRALGSPLVLDAPAVLTAYRQRCDEPPPSATTHQRG